MAIPAPNTVVNAQSAPFIVLSAGQIINVQNIVNAYRDRNVLHLNTNAGQEKQIVIQYATDAAAETDLQNLSNAIGASTIGTPGFTSITPNTSAAGVATPAVIRGRNFEVGGTIDVGPDAAIVTFVDTFTLMINITSAAPGTYNVVYTSPALVTATLTNGWVTT